MLIAELGPRPGSRPDDLDAEVDRIARYWDHAAAGRTGAIRGLAMLVGDLNRIAGVFRQGLKNDMSDPGGRDACFVAQDSAARGLEVNLDPAGERVLQGMAKDPWDGGQPHRMPPRSPRVARTAPRPDP
jgi:hypothetical protein